MGNRIPWGIAVGAVALALVAGSFGQMFYRRAERFETQARMALAHERDRRVEVDQLTDKVHSLQRDLRSQEHRTTVLRERVAVVDSISPPDTSCAPNLAARDSVILSQEKTISGLHGVIASQGRQIALLQTSTGEMMRALEARPKFYPRIIGPNVGLGVFAGVGGLRADGSFVYQVGVGITVNVGSLRF